MYDSKTEEVFNDPSLFEWNVSLSTFKFGKFLGAIRLRTHVCSEQDLTEFWEFNASNEIAVQYFI
jgi:hypothetical protein